MKRKWHVKILTFVSGCIIAGGVLVLAILSLVSSRPASLGVRDGRLASCPDSPNCVSTQTDDEAHRLEPLHYTGSAEQAIERLSTFISSQPRTRIVKQTENYLHVEYTSLLFRFVDDVEFHCDDSAKVIHFRSASRVGHSDLGVNRRRMEEVRRAFTSSNNP
jgi:uncharacterized protein (DUF1499 family)